MSRRKPCFGCVEAVEVISASCSALAWRTIWFATWRRRRQKPRSAASSLRVQPLSSHDPATVVAVHFVNRSGACDGPRFLKGLALIVLSLGPKLGRAVGAVVETELRI